MPRIPTTAGKVIPERKRRMDFIEEPNRIYAVDDAGKTVALVTFPDCSDRTVEINHTFVDDTLRGQGIAAQLLEAVTAKLRKENRKAYPSCSYAVKWFQTHPDAADVLADRR